ncbi:MAG: hypothetical protein AAF404_10445, partial [Pseudomonadota bacterium]
MRKLIIMVWLLLPVQALAEQPPVRVVGGVAWGVTELTFDEKLDADVSFNTLTALGALSRGKFYSSLAVSSALATENISEEDEIGTAARWDIDLNFGYRANSKWSVFGGYRAGSSDIDFTVRDTDIRQSEFYREHGLFAGASYTHSFGRSGRLSMTAAISRYNTDLKFTAGQDEDNEDQGEEGEAEEDEAEEFDDLEGRNQGDGNGLSLGVSWVIPLEKSLALNAQYKINLYDLEVAVEDQVFKP